MSSEVVARLFIPGRPRTKGSLKPMHRRGQGGRPCKVGLTEDHALSTPWKNTMVRALRLEQARMSGLRRPVAVAYPDPVEVHAFFRFERDLSVAERTMGEVVPSHSTSWPTDDGIGDEDKLRRNVLDALTQSGLILDDRMVIGGMNFKRWVREDEQSGVLIMVNAAPEPGFVLSMERLVMEHQA